MPKLKPHETRKRAFRSRALYRSHGAQPSSEVDVRIVALCVPLWRHCAERAHSRYGGDRPGGNHMGRDAALYCADDVLAENGITYAKDRRLWANYERHIRRAAQGAR